MMKQKLPRLFAFFTCFAVTLTTSLTASAQTKPVRVFILAGQSNMEGQGFIAADPKRNEGKGSLDKQCKEKRAEDVEEQVGEVEAEGVEAVEEVVGLE